MKIHKIVLQAGLLEETIFFIELWQLRENHKEDAECVLGKYHTGKAVAKQTTIVFTATHVT